MRRSVILVAVGWWAVGGATAQASSPTPTPTPIPTTVGHCVEPFTTFLSCGVLCGGQACLPYYGGSTCFDVVAPPDCCWTASIETGVECSPYPEATITSGGQGCGNHQVCFTVGRNPCYHTPEYVTVTVGDQYFNVCEYFATPPIPTATFYPTWTPTATPTPTPTSTIPLFCGPTPCPFGYACIIEPPLQSRVCACAGSCQRGDEVTIQDLVLMVNVVLGNAAVSTCAAGDVNGDGQISVDEILQAVNNALGGCPAS